MTEEGGEPVETTKGKLVKLAKLTLNSLTLNLGKV